MRRLWVVCGFALVAAVGAGLSAGRAPAQPAGGEKDAGQRKVTVTGYATVAVKPDTARVSFVVKGGGSDFKSAAAECDKKGALVEKALRELKLGGLEVKKGPRTVAQLAGGFPGWPMGGPGGFPGGPAGPGPGEPPGRGPGGMPPGGPMGFPGGPLGGSGIEVSRTYSVTATFGNAGGAGPLDDLVPVADKLLAAVVGTGLTEAPGLSAGSTFDGLGRPAHPPARPEFARANPSALRQEALKAAVADALASARAATGVADLTLKNVVTITDQSPGAAGGRADPSGEVELTARVVVTFGY